MIDSDPRFLARPPYTPGHRFAGRHHELKLLTDWARSSEHSVLVIEAIGGMGKSMLSWQWAKEEATKDDSSFEAIFWYSFYERGADMNDFCAHALAYALDVPVEPYRRRKTADLASELSSALTKRPLLLVLDGIERILVAYNRPDAAQISDYAFRDANPKPFDQQFQDCTRLADANLLRELTRIWPSKALISSRLMPSALLERDGTLRAGVLHEELRGLQPADAEAMLISVGVNGDSKRMRKYLEDVCGFHPLLVGIVGGLVAKYIPAPGSFDRWLEDHLPDEVLNDDIAKNRARMLGAAFEALSPDCRTLLCRLALISEAVDYETVLQINPLRPDLPEAVDPPDEWMQEEQHRQQTAAYEEYCRNLEAWRNSSSFAAAEKALRSMLEELAARGLLHWDRKANKFDLHPVIRSYATTTISPEQRERIAAPVVDHFSAREDLNADAVVAIDDLRNGLQVARTLLFLRRNVEAAHVIADLQSALFWNLEAWDLYLSLVKPLFPRGWTQAPAEIDTYDLGCLWSDIALALNAVGKPKEAMPLGELALELDINEDYPAGILIKLRNQTIYADDAFWLYDVRRLTQMLSAATLAFGNSVDLALCLLRQVNCCCRIGDFESAETHWSRFDSLPRPTRRNLYRHGYGEYCFARLQLYRNRLDDALLSRVRDIATAGNNRWVVRMVFWLRGEWKLSAQEWAEAANSFDEYLRLTREVGLETHWEEARLALARVKCGDIHGTLELADRLSGLADPPHIALAELYLALGETEKALLCARSAYVEAWGLGPPDVCWRTVQMCCAVFGALKEPMPVLETADRDNIPPFRFQEKLFGYIESKTIDKSRSVM